MEYILYTTTTHYNNNTASPAINIINITLTPHTHSEYFKMAFPPESQTQRLPNMTYCL